MAPPASTFRYPPVNLDPTVDDCLRALRGRDYAQCAGLTAASWAYGFLAGRPARFAVAGLMAGIGFTFGSMVALQNARGRLMGLRENDREVARLGRLPPAAAERVQELLAFDKFN